MDVVLRNSIVILALCLTLSGCRGPDASIELLESELRWMEDQLYLLDQELAHTHAKLMSSQRYNQTLKNELRQRRTGDGSDSTSGPEAGDGRPRIKEIPFDESDLQVPDVDLGPVPSGDEANESDPFRDDQDTALPGADDSIDLEDITQGKPADLRIARIVLNSRLTGGYDFDGHPGDEGLLLVIEPQNAAGQYVPLPGDVSVSVRDPSRNGEDGRIADWEYTAVESLDLLRKTLLGRGFHLQLPWPDQPPARKKLSVVARYRSSDGQQLETRRTIEIDLGLGDATTQTAVQQRSFLPSRAVNASSRVTSLPAPPAAPLPPKPQARTTRPWQPTRPGTAQHRQRQSVRATRTPTWSPYR